MTYEPSSEQRAVIHSDAPTVVALGGAGSGKTTTAAAAAARMLNEFDEERAAIRRATPFGTVPIMPPMKRALFLSFSRTAVSQIIDRSASVLRAHVRRIDVVTFHGLAWRILNDFGRYYGIAHPFRIRSAAETQLGVAASGLSYDQLLPEAQKILAIPTVAAYYESRYASVICDEFQDTSDAEWEFMQAVAPTARRLLLGDVNQCIYAGMKNIDPTERVANALALAGAQRIVLPPRSFRDPSGILPAAAQAALERRFDDAAIEVAVLGGRLVVHRTTTSEVIQSALHAVAAERMAGKSVSVFTHTHAATADLSTALTRAEIDHEQVGFAEAFGDGLRAQFMLLRWALTHESGGRDSLAVYLKSVSRGSGATAQANAIRLKTNPDFERTIQSVTAELYACATPALDLDRLHEVLRSAHQRLGFPRGQETWILANRYLRRSARILEAGGDIHAVAEDMEEMRLNALVGFTSERAKPVQVMNLHQTKGREADATVLLLQADEYHGRESEPYATGSRLLYVCLTRARQTAHIIVPDRVHGLWLPLVNSCIRIGRGASK